MKLLPVICILLAAPLSLKAQGDSFFSFDNRAMFFPKEVTASSISLAKYIESNYKTDLSRITAAYRWITANITYDKDSMLAINWSKETDEKIAATLRRKKGVCDNFASVFTDILLKMNIPSYVVNGNCKTGGPILRQAHSWSAVQVNQQWLLCDPTWDIMYTNSPRYFLIHPEEFIETHWPFDPLWQLLPYYIPYTAFERGAVGRNGNALIQSPGDSVRAFLALEPVQQMEAAAGRMKQGGVHSEPQKNWYGYNQMNIAIVRGEKHMQLYNAAVQDLNKATGLFNSFVIYRNNMFLPPKPDHEITAMLTPVKELIKNAQEKMASMRHAKDNFQYDTGDLQFKLETLTRKVATQASFLKTYIATPAPERVQLFYR